MNLGLDNESYWRMSPQESFRWIKIKTPKIQIGGLSQDDLEEMAANIYNDENGEYL